MTKRMDFMTRAQQEITAGRRWRAKEILRGNIGTRPFDPGLYEAYGNLLRDLGDEVEAGEVLAVLDGLPDDLLPGEGGADGLGREVDRDRGRDEHAARQEPVSPRELAAEGDLDDVAQERDQRHRQEERKIHIRVEFS